MMKPFSEVGVPKIDRHSAALVANSLLLIVLFISLRQDCAAEIASASSSSQELKKTDAEIKLRVMNSFFKNMR